jgi:diacylglycerol kinase (ATP)
VASYPLRWLAVWRTSRRLKVRAIPDGGEPESFRAFQVSVANSNSFGGHFHIDAENSPHTGELSVARLHPRDLLSWLKLLPKLLSGHVGESPDARVSRVRAIRIETDPPSVYSGDGETMGKTPVDISVRPAALSVFVPRNARDGT